MDVPLTYAIAAGGSIVLLLFIHSATHLTRFLRPCRTLIRKYFLLLTLVGRHRFFGPWTFAQVSLQLVYLVANIFSASFRVSTAKEASVRAGHISLINMMPAYFGFHLSFICDMLGVSLATYRLFHASTRDHVCSFWVASRPDSCDQQAELQSGRVMADVWTDRERRCVQ